jgi:hypothetical protein
MALKKSGLPVPRVQKETVEVAALGGEVVVWGLGLADKLRLATWEGQRFSQMCEGLAVAVRDASGDPLWDAAAWDAWGGQHLEDALKLWQAVERVSGMSEAQAEKNLPDQRSDSP